MVLYTFVDYLRSDSNWRYYRFDRSISDRIVCNEAFKGMLVMVSWLGISRIAKKTDYRSNTSETRGHIQTATLL